MTFNRLLAKALAGASLALPAVPALAQNQFQDVTGSSGLGGTHPESWGIAIGDINGDRYPDIFQPNHRNRANLWRNNANGTFTEFSATADVSKVPGWKGGRANVDKHGPAFGDIDNDGDADLIWTPSQSSDPILRNDGTGRFTNIESTTWVGSIYHNADRQPLFFDANRDGRLDIFFAALSIPGIYRQTAAGTYGSISNISLIGCGSFEGSFAHLADVHSNPGLELICAPRNGVYPASVTAFSSTGSPFSVTTSIPQYDRVADVGTGDFDGNGFTDIVQVIGTQRFSDAVQINPNRIEAQMIQSGTAVKFVKFRTTGVVSVFMDTEVGDCTTQGCPSAIEIGAGGYNPAALTFTLDPANTANHGIQNDGEDLNAGYDPATQTWTFESVGDSEKYTHFSFTSTQPMTNLQFQGSQLGDAPARPVLLMNGGNSSWSDASATSGLTPNKCSTVGVGDFDNDMDQDIYFGCTGGAVNAPNILYRNNGNGTFTLVPSAAGAGGYTGPAYANGNGVGTTETVSLTDFDLDGWLDIFVSNGNNMRPQGYGGPNQYFKNLGGSNRWLQLDLRGTTSNRDAVGAVVRVTAGGKTQLREQNGGYHRWSQNFKRIHLGLASNTTANIQITWPNGVVQTHNAVASNGVYEIVQGGAITLVAGTVDTDNDGLTDAQELQLGTNPNVADTDGGTVNDGQEVQNGTNPLNPTDDIPPPVSPVCGTPTIATATDRATFLWKDCNGSEMWHIRTTGGGTTTNINFIGRIESDGGVGALSPFSIETSDILDTTSTPNTLNYTMRVTGTGTDGINFQVSPNACFTPISPGGLPVLLGSGRVALSTPSLDMTTVEACFTEPDTDGDGLTDADEEMRGTNPNVADTDGGGVDDGDEVEAGTNPLNASDDNDLVASDFCGTPTMTPATDRATFLYKDCATTGIWHLVVLGGGTPSELIFRGRIDAAGGVTVTPRSIEPTDVLDTTTNPDQLTYALRVYTTGRDDFDFTVGSNACYTPNNPTLPVYLGSGRVVLGAASVDLTTAGACAAP